MSVRRNSFCGKHIAKWSLLDGRTTTDALDKEREALCLHSAAQAISDWLLFLANMSVSISWPWGRHSRREVRDCMRGRRITSHIAPAFPMALPASKPAMFGSLAGHANIPLGLAGPATYPPDKKYKLCYKREILIYINNKIIKQT